MVPILNTTTHYGLVAKVLHWSSVTLLVTLIVVASQFEDLLASAEKTRLMALHTSIGLVFFLVMLARLGWRQVNHNPIHSYSIKRWQKLTAISLHRSIYIILITQCVTGIVVAITAGQPMMLFSLFEWGPLVKPHNQLHRIILDIHHFISIMIYPLLAIHISAAIYHQIFGLVDD